MSEEHEGQSPSAADQLVRLLSVDGSFRVVACVNTSVVQEAARRHDLTGLAAVALGRALTAGQLLATLTKGDERISLQLTGDGPLRGLMVDAWANGDVRGYVHEPVLAEHEGSGRPWVASVLGRNGVVQVFRDLGLKDLYQGTGTLTVGEVDEDLETYLRVSEQIPSALGCEVLLDEAGAVIASAGVLVQAMPGTKEQEGDPVREAQHRLRTGVLRRSLSEGARDPCFLAAQLVADFLLRILFTGPVRFHCPCDKERVTRALITLGPVELEGMVQDLHGAEVTCHFCANRYTFGEAEVLALIQEIRAKLN